MESHLTPGGRPASSSGRQSHDTQLTLRTLLVEDHADTAAALAILLVARGYQVRIAPDGESALRAAEEESPDVALLDLGLPGIDGYQVARQLCQQRQEKRPLLVALTGHGTEADRLRSHQAGIDLHLVKPVEPGPLLNLLRRFRALLCPKSGPSSLDLPILSGCADASS